MKAAKLILLSFLVSLFFAPGLFAQDSVKTAGVVNSKVVLDNDRVRVMEVEFGPGVSTAWHHHPDHVIYVQSDGTLEITDKGKEPVMINFKAGTTLYSPAVTHKAKNIGTTTLKLMLTEIKPTDKKTSASEKK